MQNLNDVTQSCRNPEIVASRLTAMRNIHLRQELNTISQKIQEQYKERLPALHLVTIAAYEQVFQRQPLSQPEELRRHAIKYGLEYYQLSIEKLRVTEAQNGLYPNHDRLSCSDKNCPLHQSNINVETDQAKSSLSNGSSTTSDHTLDSTTTKTTSESASVSSSDSSAVLTDASNPSSPSIVSGTSDDESSNSTSTSTSNQSMTTIRNDRLATSNKTLSRTKTPKIVISRASNDSISSTDTKSLSIITGNHRKSARKRRKKRK